MALRVAERIPDLIGQTPLGRQRGHSVVLAVPSHFRRRVLSGGSRGAAVHASLRVALRLRLRQRTPTLIPDDMERYLSKGIVELPSAVTA